uniref:Dynein light chain Tctex-type 3 n=1 Tax=Oncorhynchus mykiss TaxID=8022 RepID=A0A8C7Q2Z1_ONCMY
MTCAFARFNAGQCNIDPPLLLDCVVSRCNLISYDIIALTDCLCIEGIIGEIGYNQNKVNQWTASIVEHSLTQLVKQGETIQKTGAGLHTANSCYWDTATDGSSTVRWENRTMYCVVCVFAVAVTC